jgi:AraC-like DNA-binding protein
MRGDMAQSGDKSGVFNLAITLGKKATEKIKWPEFNISEKLRRGFSDIVELRQGLKLVINKYNLKKNIKVGFTIEDPPIEFAFCLSGRADSEIRDKAGNGREINIKNGQAAMFYFPDSEGYIKLYGDEPVKILSLHISPEFLNSFVEGDYDGLPGELARLMKGEREIFFFNKNDMSPAMLIALQQIFDSELKGPARKIHLESKALELITLELSGVIERQGQQSVYSLKHGEKEKIAEIRNLIIEKIADPPSLFELASQAGMSHSKLNYGFKKMYNTTVFGFVRDYRMELSRKLLEDGRLSITEIAYEAGWSSPSHFSRQFRKQFGAAPKKYQSGRTKR